MSFSRSISDKQQPASDQRSLYQRFQDKKRGKSLSDEDIQKYTGKTRDELAAWAGSKPGVGKNQLAGKAGMGPASGLAGIAIADGFGGWGPGAEPNDVNRGMKFPPAKPADGARQ